jgi:hypothetical protein
VLARVPGAPDAMAEEEVEAPVAAPAHGEEGVMRIGRRCYVSNLAW